MEIVNKYIYGSLEHRYMDANAKCFNEIVGWSTNLWLTMLFKRLGSAIARGRYSYGPP